jgi:hypothetical protein
MADTGFWYVGQMPDDALAALAPRIGAFCARATADPGVQAVLEDWRAAPSRIHGLGEGQVRNRWNERFHTAFWVVRPPEEVFTACGRDDLDDATWDLSALERPRLCRAAFAAVGLIPPVSLLYLGLGPQRTAWLPGVMGVFALTAAEVTAAADHVRKAHSMSPSERAGAIARMEKWLRMGSSPSFPVGHLLEALPLLFATAAEEGRGLVAATAVL